MIDPVVLWTYVAIVAGLVFIPGPATVLTMARSGTSGTRAGLAAALGIAVGDLIHTAFAVATGALGGALRQSPVVQRWQNRVVGTIYCAFGVRLALQEK